MRTECCHLLWWVRRPYHDGSECTYVACGSNLRHQDKTISSLLHIVGCRCLRFSRLPAPLLDTVRYSSSAPEPIPVVTIMPTLSLVTASSLRCDCWGQSSPSQFITIAHLWINSCQGSEGRNIAYLRRPCTVKL